MRHRNPFRVILRIVLCTGLIVVGMLVPIGVPIVEAVVGVHIAYAGLDRRTVQWTVIFLTVIELLFALNLGMLSLSYLAAAGLLLVVGRLVFLPPWSAADGWSVFMALRAVVVATVAGLVVMLSAVLVGILYGNGQVVQRMAAQLAPARIGVLAVASVVLLLTLRRIDVPWFRRIHFGT